jgi:hypothetical protein
MTTGRDTRSSQPGEGFGERATPAPDGDLTPWGEPYDALAEAALNDKSAPPFLALAAFLHKHGKPDRFRELIADAVGLSNEDPSLLREDEA